MDCSTGFLCSHPYALLVLPLALLVFTAGYVSQEGLLTEESLKNAEYQGIYPGAVQLTDGYYQGEPFVEDGALRPVVVWVEPYAFGDLDGDGMNNLATRLLGDRVQVQGSDRF